MARLTTGARALAALAREAEGCRRCDLWRHATQVVCGEGPPTAEVLFVGEQPGDQEDLAGAPFVGPAGRLFDRALAEAGIDRARVYLTNAVKHFKWTPRGKRRIHERPNVEEILACHLWLERELAAIRPRIVVALGAVAARALFGPAVRVTRDRGKALTSAIAPITFASVHPSSVLRAPDADARQTAWRAFVADLRAVRRAMTPSARAARPRIRQEPPHVRANSRTDLGRRRAADVSSDRR